VIIIGVDPGIGGAIAVFGSESGRLLTVFDMPVVEDGPKGRRRVNPYLLKSELLLTSRTFPALADVENAVAVIEKVGPLPNEGAVGAFSFGVSAGVVFGLMAGIGIPVRFITPQEWKKRLRFPPKADKEFSRGRAIETWPDKAALFARKRDDGRSEAALIALAGSKQ
jgi:crossover junction endodeoxyribonuclease RuvC